MVKTGILAEQLMRGVTIMVSSRSLGFEIVRAAMMAGTAQAMPENKETKLRPFIPKRLIRLSER